MFNSKNVCWDVIYYLFIKSESCLHKITACDRQSLNFQMYFFYELFDLKLKLKKTETYFYTKL